MPVWNQWRWYVRCDSTLCCCLLFTSVYLNVLNPLWYWPSCSSTFSHNISHVFPDTFLLFLLFYLSLYIPLHLFLLHFLRNWTFFKVPHEVSIIFFPLCNLTYASTYFLVYRCTHRFWRSQLVMFQTQITPTKKIIFIGVLWI